MQCNSIYTNEKLQRLKISGMQYRLNVLPTL